MDKELKQDFTMRISNSNRSGLVVIMYEMLFAYMEDSREAVKNQDMQKTKEALRHADQVLKELTDNLNFKYEMSIELYQIYTFCRKLLMQTLYKRDTTGIDQAKKLLTNLYEAFCEIAAKDTSKTLMQNTQQVYAGMTYQRGSLTETLQDPEASRGFLA